MKRLIAIFSLTFVAGAAALLIARSPSPDPSTATVETTAAAPAAAPDHSAHETESGSPCCPGHAAEEHEPAPTPVPPSAPPPEATPTEDLPERVTVYFCGEDDIYGVSYEAPCPLDGKPMVPREVPRSSFEDLRNPTCPICKMPGRPDIFGIYKGTLVRFGCPACDQRFLADPERYIRAARAQTEDQD